MRGRTFKNALIVLDEAQNTTPTQMKLFLTRIGENCTVVVNGDLKQKDISGPSGLEDALKRLSFIPSVKVVEFGRKDVVRSGLVQEVVEAYEQNEALAYT
jgi:phosphate starvation-inducible PhoH-like protein